MLAIGKDLDFLDDLFDVRLLNGLEVLVDSKLVQRSRLTADNTAPVDIAVPGERVGDVNTPSVLLEVRGQVETLKMLALDTPRRTSIHHPVVGHRSETLTCRMRFSGSSC